MSDETTSDQHKLNNIKLQRYVFNNEFNVNIPFQWKSNDTGLDLFNNPKSHNFPSLDGESTDSNAFDQYSKKYNNLIFELNNQCALDTQKTFIQYLYDMHDMCTLNNKIVNYNEIYSKDFIDKVNDNLANMDTMLMYNKFPHYYDILYTKKITYNDSIILHINIICGNDIIPLQCNEGFSLDDIAYKVQCYSNFKINNQKKKEDIKSIKFKINYIQNIVNVNIRYLFKN